MSSSPRLPNRLPELRRVRPARRALTALVAGVVAVMTAGTALPAAAAVGTSRATAPMKGLAAVQSLAAAIPASETDPSLVPHYFGPYPNWANSPQVLSNAVVTFTSGGGTGAAAVATVNPKGGGIDAITVTAPGTGYTSPPDVLIEAAGVTVTPAGATAAISLGVLTSIAVDEAGFGFTAPAVTLTGGNPTLGLEATAVASGGVDDVTLATPGSGYAIQPVVVFSLPELAGGTPATATATMDGAGAVTSITLVTPGSGYTHAPTVTILDAGQLRQGEHHDRLDRVAAARGGQGHVVHATARHGRGLEAERGVATREGDRGCGEAEPGFVDRDAGEDPERDRSGRAGRGHGHPGGLDEHVRGRRVAGARCRHRDRIDATAFRVHGRHSRGARAATAGEGHDRVREHLWAVGPVRVRPEVVRDERRIGLAGRNGRREALHGGKALHWGCGSCCADRRCRRKGGPGRHDGHHAGYEGGQSPSCRSDPSELGKPVRQARR